MKNKFTLFFLILCTFSVSAQQNTLFNKADININGKQLLMIGEFHFVQEFYDIQYNIIEHTILQNSKIKNFQLLLENNFCLNYYLDKLILENDSVSLKEFLRYYSDVIQDTLSPLNQTRYDFYMKLYYLSNSLKDRTFRFTCFENSLLLTPLTFTILDILKKYTVSDSSFLAQITFLNSFLDKKFLELKFNTFHQSFGNYFFENRGMLKETLTSTDFYYLSEMMRRLQPNKRYGFVTQERENMMFEHVNNSYNDSTFFFCITGAGHIRKPYRTSELLLNLKKNGATKPVLLIEMLERSKTSYFKDKIILCNLVPLGRKTNNKTITKALGYYPLALQKHSDYLNSLLIGNITLIDMRKIKIKNAHKITDYMVVVKEVNIVW